MEENPFEPENTKQFIIKIIDIKNGWVQYQVEGGPKKLISEKISEMIKEYILLE